MNKEKANQKEEKILDFLSHLHDDIHNLAINVMDKLNRAFPETEVKEQSILIPEENKNLDRVTILMDINSETIDSVYSDKDQAIKVCRANRNLSPFTFNVISPTQSKKAVINNDWNEDFIKWYNGESGNYGYVSVDKIINWIEEHHSQLIK